MRKSSVLASIVCFVTLGFLGVYDLLRRTDYASIKLFLHEHIKNEYRSDMEGATELRIKKGTSIDAAPSSYDKNLLTKERLLVNEKMQWETDLSTPSYDFPRHIIHVPSKRTELSDLVIGENIIRYETIDARGNINRAEAKVYVED